MISFVVAACIRGCFFAQKQFTLDKRIKGLRFWMVKMFLGRFEIPLSGNGQMEKRTKREKARGKRTNSVDQLESRAGDAPQTRKR